MNKQTGFTLIELIMVIVILGILAATALPKFVDMSNEAEVAALQGVAGGLRSANTINRATFMLNPGSAASVTNCDQAGTLLDGGLPAGYSLGALAINAGSTVDCTLTQTSSGASAVVAITRNN